MPMTINTNTISLNAQRNLSTSQSSLATAMQRLSSGLRVNSAKDDAAGLAIAERMLGTTSGASSMFGRLSDIGFDVKSDGSISVNDTKLTNGLANLDQLRKVFANSDPVTPANDGVVLQMRKLTDRMLGFDGTLQSRTDGLQHRLDLNQTQQSQLEDRVTRTEARLRAQYSALDTQMNTLNGLSSYVQQQITNWNKSTA